MVRGSKAERGIDERVARLVLVTLMSGAHEMARRGCSADELVGHIRSEHFVDERTAADMASMYLDLFSGENQRTWDEASEVGFREFCQREWTVEWWGESDWHTKHGGSFPCSARASLTFAVQDEKMLHDHLSAELRSNPFLSADDIHALLREQIESDLDNDMDEYCNADDYYEPYLDEFVSEGTYESEAKWRSWGLRALEFTGSGDIDFEP